MGCGVWVVGDGLWVAEWVLRDLSQKRVGVQDFKKLRVWQESADLTRVVYRLTSRFPESELFGLASQMRRASNSVGSNLAEGCGRGSNADFARFIQMAIGSACELEHHLCLARDLQYLDPDAYADLAPRVIRLRKKLISLRRKVRSTNRR